MTPFFAYLNIVDKEGRRRVMDLLTKIKDKAKQVQKTIVLPEGNEERVIKAAAVIRQEQIAKVILLGDVALIQQTAADIGIDSSDFTIINPADSPQTGEYAAKLFALRKAKGMTSAEAAKLIQNPLYYGAMMVKEGAADGLVAGSINTTGDVLRPALQIIRTAPGISVVSGAFIMLVPDCEYGANGTFVFADCAVNPNPTAEQLAEIAITSAVTAKKLAGIEPVVGMLSFSTCGSAEHALVEKVAQATRLAREKAPELAIGGEFQADAAIVPAVGKAKAPRSTIAGKVNVLVFPDLQAGNISYKLVQRLARAEAIGPILQGMAKPVNDLSRGCSVDDIVNVVAITAVQAQT